MLNKFGNIFAIFLILAFAVDLFVWREIFFVKAAGGLEMRFLNVGQGDSELLILPGGIKILTDAGPDSKVVSELEKIPQLSDKYIDLAIISHPQLDHFNGFRYLLGRYRIGAFIYNGRSDAPGVGEWRDLTAKIEEKNIPLIKLSAGDKIKNWDSKIDFLSPDAELVQSAELNDTGFVELIESKGMRVLLAADIGAEVEKILVGRFDLSAEILKVAHHGSRFSSSPEFLKDVGPRAAIIGVGKGNKYGHPATESLQRIAAASATIFRTDRNGQITVSAGNGKLKVFTEK